MPDQTIPETLFALHINAQCDCACPDGSYPEEPSLGPLITYLEITPACNNNCPGCPNALTFRQGLDNSRWLGVTQWSTLLKKLRPYLQRVKLTGGEATLHPDFSKIVTLLADMVVPFDLFTNGRWTDPAKVVRILAGAKQFGGCLISLHGPTAASHETFSGVPGCFAETVGNIRLAIAGGIPVVLSTVITQQNCTLIDELLALGEELRVSHIVFNRYVGRPIPGITPTARQLQQAVRYIEGRRNAGYRVKFSVCLPQCFVVSSSQGCVAGRAACTIDPSGNLRPCNHAPLIAGNLLHQELDELWFSEAMTQWRQFSKNCATCAVFSQCRGGCQAQAILNECEHDPLMTKVTLTSHNIPYNRWSQEPSTCWNGVYYVRS